ncbi:Got1/Sft2-like family-domain-containing protein [Cokeromyces recurvatus]|uniref:Got1/Sft2-like family-domain-containing protein n=1 Tax=Cokeromyces recurvatus TaxID=90255 RepID=UPI0022201684|nr:Got1/Sft2-like family-domain-containing protein [Cokeromyces recurvatus]KAI7898960.1 Got1/Sft2-like family-domain-containing protein [Cokeromyces recurvatus]
MKFGFFSSDFSDQGTVDDGSWKFCGLDRSQRMFAFGLCFVAGALLSILSTLILLVGNVVAFAVIYSCGNIISLFSLTFIVGIPKQIKTMFAPVRFWATVIYIVLLALTLALSIWLKNFALSIVLVIIQFAALVWYSASYIPYGREIIRRFFGSCVTSI